jgi:nucleoside-diphosphate-sugar epimerase
MTTIDERQIVLVTGGSGFIATHCLLALHRAGYALRATLRSPERARELDAVLHAAHGSAVPVTWVSADLTRDAGWAEAVTGADHVLHVASPLPRILPKDPAALIEPARDGALRVLRAAARAGVRRVVMTSSTAAICYGRGQIARPFTEDDWSDPDGADNSSYTRSKTYAERAAWEFMRTDGGSMELVTVNPGAVLGPVLEKDYGTSAEIVLKLLTGAFPGIPDFDFPLVDVRDVADLHVAALRHPAAAGRRFLCVSGNMTMREIADVLRAHAPACAAKIPRRRFPNWVVRAASLVDPVTRAVVFELGIRRECDTTRARKVLGFAPRPVAEAVRATADSLIAHGVVE